MNTKNICITCNTRIAIIDFQMHLFRMSIVYIHIGEYLLDNADLYIYFYVSQLK